MRLVVPALLVLSAFALVPAPAQAHVCYDFYDAVCVAQCIGHVGHPCSLHRPDPPGVAPCPAGTSGVVVVLGQTLVPACVAVPTVTLGSCPPGELGVIVYVDGRPLNTCVSIA